MTTMWYVVGCILVGGGTVLFMLATSPSEEPLSERPAPSVRPGRAPTSSPAAGGAQGRKDVRPAADVGRDDDFSLWERQLASSRHVGWEHDQRALRDLARWERESRRRGRGR